MKNFRKAVFEPMIGQTFTIRPHAGRSIEAKLASITSRHISDQYESFALNFDPPTGEPALPDDSYLMENEQLGQVVIFISATHAGTPDPRKYYYEAVFNVYIGPDVC